MWTVIILCLLILILFAIVGFLWIRERRYLQKKTSEAMQTETWQEITEEREAALRKRRLFREALEKEAKSRNP